MNTKWMMGKLNVESATLMDDAEPHFTNLSNNNSWMIDHNPKEQIVALATQYEALQTEMTYLKSNQAHTVPNNHLLPLMLL